MSLLHLGLDWWRPGYIWPFFRWEFENRRAFRSGSVLVQTVWRRPYLSVDYRCVFYLSVGSHWQGPKAALYRNISSGEDSTETLSGCAARGTFPSACSKISTLMLSSHIFAISLSRIRWQRRSCLCTWPSSSDGCNARFRIRHTARHNCPSIFT